MRLPHPLIKVFPRGGHPKSPTSKSDPKASQDTPSVPWTPPGHLGALQPQKVGLALPHDAACAGLGGEELADEVGVPLSPRRAADSHEDP